MKEVIELKTERLLLRQWRKSDFVDFALLNADPVVMEFFPNVLSEDESNTLANKIESLIAERGWGFWAVEHISNKVFIGFVGLHEPHYELPFNPCVEIGWRLARQYWGKGYATEAGKAALEFAFNHLKLNEVYSFAVVDNMKSIAVMERLKLKNTLSNFEHPMIPENSPLREHVLYKIDKASWDSSNV